MGTQHGREVLEVHGSYLRLSWEDDEERSDWGRDTMLSELLR